MATAMVVAITTRLYSNVVTDWLNSNLDISSLNPSPNWVVKIIVNINTIVFYDL
jgi:hypothetical protein